MDLGCVDKQQPASTGQEEGKRLHSGSFQFDAILFGPLAGHTVKLGRRSAVERLTAITTATRECEPDTATDSTFEAFAMLQTVRITLMNRGITRSAFHTL